MNTTCKVCQKEKNNLRRSARGKLVRFCEDCRGFYRCLQCNTIKEAKHFTCQIKKYAFSDGERIRSSRCYQCDSKSYYARRERYTKRLRRTATIEAFIQTNLRRWRVKTPETDLTKEYLVGLWNKQEGKCFYTNLPISLDRSQRWQKVSLDRKDPALGYNKGNVVWTTMLTNTSKNIMSYDEFVNFCHTVANRHSR